MKIQAITSESLHLSFVKLLGKANAKTLGMFPEGAFDDYAESGNILIALDSSGQFAGYLLYRETRNVAHIVHLCVSNDFRKRGVGRQLMNSLIERTRSCYGISLKCRPEYAANSIWPKLGFSALRTVTGRGKDGIRLTQWWFDQTTPPLFAPIHKQEPALLLGVMDANVFFDLYETEVNRPQCIESQALLADWLSDSIELLVTPELRIEIARNPEPNGQRSMAYLDNFRELDATRDRYDSACTNLQRHFPSSSTTHDSSDLKQLAWAVAGGAAYFLTRDEAVLEMAQAVQTELGVLILRPRDLIVNLDEIRRSTEYQPARLAGSLLEVRRAKGTDEDLIETLRHVSSEQRHEFCTRLRNHMVHSDRCETYIILDRSKELLSLFCLEWATNSLQVPFLRVRRSQLSATLLRQVVWQILQRGAIRGSQFIRVTDPHLSDLAPPILADFGFFNRQGWQKLSMPKMCSVEEAQTWLEGSGAPVGADALSEWSSMLRVAAAARDARLLWEQERRLWPGKLSDAPIPTYIIPIQARWASQLFDEGLAEQTLYGREERLALNTESVYYRAARPGIKAPARVLWYVSSNDAFDGVMALRACSLVQEVAIAFPKDLYKKYQRLGVYNWADVYATAKGDVNNKIMAILFSRTELLKKAIPLDQSLSILREEGINPGTTFQGPREISPRVFERLYARAST